jgi:hypothetical protein
MAAHQFQLRTQYDAFHVTNATNSSGTILAQ